MDDLVERLRTGARTMSELNQAAHEAADEITRLTAALAEAEAERDRLRDALRRIAEQRYSAGDAPYIAARALTRPAAQPEGEHD